MKLPDDTLFKGIRALAAEVRARRVSPVELAELALARLETTGRELNAVVTVLRDKALAQARTAEREIKAGRYRGPLHGIPYGAKDLLAARGAPTTWGAEPYRNQTFAYDATVVRKLEESGAVLVAKLAMIELAGGMNYNNADSSFTGPARTPWNRDYWAGGSSSGSGAAVAAGLVAFAIGSETSGSILCPASFCGLTGLRPTYGRVSRHGAMALCWTLDKLGPMCHSADDCGIVLDAIAGPDGNDPTADARPFDYAEPPARAARRAPLRVALLKESYEGAHAEVRDNLLAALTALSKDVEVDRDVATPDFPAGPMIASILATECASAFEDLYESGDLAKLRSPVGRVEGYAYAATPATDYVRAMRLRAPMRKAWGRLFEKYDLLAAPGYDSVAYPVGKDFDTVYTDVKTKSPITPTNLIGVPAICLPSGFGRENLPTSIQFIGAPFAENTLLEVANLYQSRTDWHRRRPAGV